MSYRINGIDTLLSAGSVLQLQTDGATRLELASTGHTLSNSTHIKLSSTRVFVGTASTTGLQHIQRYVVQFTAPTMSSGIDGGSTVSTHTVTGLSTGTVLSFTPTNPINALYTVRPHCSTANELKMIFGHNGISTLGTGESTNRGVLLEFRF